MRRPLNDNKDGCLIEPRRHCIAFIGSVGVPNRYGGFESFVQAIGPIIAANNIEVLVTCDSNRYNNKDIYWKGIKRKFINVTANGVGSILHDFIAFLNVVKTADCVVVLGVSAGTLFPIMRFISVLNGTKLIVNVDGLEWRRAKFSKYKRIFLWCSDALAQICAHKIIYDSRALRPFLLKQTRSKALYVPYSGRSPDDNRTPNDSCYSTMKYGLAISRIEPENNCEMILEAAALSELRLFYIGNWDQSPYSKELRERYSSYNNIELIDPVYEPAAIDSYRKNSAFYVHGHSVGGTNPSLVEVLFHDMPIFAFDCIFNRLTARKAALYFQNARDLESLIVKHQEQKVCQASREALRKKYSDVAVAQKYMEVISDHKI